MNTGRTAAALVAGVLAVSAPAFAHHGNAAYEGTVTVVKDATVTKLAWANPHTIVQFDAKNDKGEVEHWAAELGSPSALACSEWTKTSVTPDVITSISPGETKNPVGRIDHIVLADGSQLRDSAGGVTWVTPVGAADAVAVEAAAAAAAPPGY
jgi:hypothetical protein